MQQEKHSLVRIFVLLISLGLSISAGRTIFDLWHRRDIVRVRQLELSKITKENEALSQKLNEVKSDAYVERTARDKLGFVKDGEVMVLLPQATPSAGGISDAVPGGWRQWWKLFF
jgi:cell division protein FtsB